ncbi:DNA-binding response regulator [Burkholderia gladioli]|nr:DNA-binding response regulator [Burkholderia gladioli]
MRGDVVRAQANLIANPSTSRAPSSSLSTRYAPPRTAMTMEAQSLRSEIKVIVADDHPIVVAGILKLLEGTPDIEVVESVTDVDALEQALESRACDILISDYEFGDTRAHDGIQMIERLRHDFPHLKILMLTMHDDIILVRRLISMGVAGFLSKSTPALSKLPEILRAIERGEQYLDAAIAQALRLADMQLASASGRRRMVMLSKREYEVVRLFARGMQISEIARQTGRSVKTISTQKGSAMRKMEVDNDADLIIRFLDLGERLQPAPEA